MSSWLPGQHPYPRKKPRGGVAVYRNTNSAFVMNVITSDLRDCVVIEICNSPVIIVAVYIPPINSEYFPDTLFLKINIPCN